MDPKLGAKANSPKTQYVTQTRYFIDFSSRYVSDKTYGWSHTNPQLHFLSGSGWNCSSILILHASRQQTCMTYTIAVCTVKNSWWWKKELSETCGFSFQ